MKCAKHPDVETNLRCGKCGRPICPRCMVQTPVGARCPDCAKLYRVPTFRLSTAYYLRAAGAALGMAIVIGVVWGIIESYLPFRFFSLIIGAGVGWAIGEVVSRAVNRKRGVWLAVIGSAAVAIAYGLTIVVDLFRFEYVSFSGLRIFYLLAAIAIGIYMAVIRLR
jgi:hypothetical protein